MVHEAAATGFSRNTDRYHRSRPAYHPELVRRVANRYGNGTLVELGAGTGIFTRQLLEYDLKVVAIEPVYSMRDALTNGLPDADVRVGAAEDIPIDDGTVDTVIASQSFHWFDYVPALNEIYRVLRPGGHLVTVWNTRDNTVDWVAALTALLDRFVGDAPRYRSMAWRRAINDDGRFGSVDEWRTANPLPTDVEGVIERTLSTSYIAALSQERQTEVAEQVRATVEPIGPAFDYPYVSQLQAWRTLDPMEFHE